MILSSYAIGQNFGSVILSKSALDSCIGKPAAKLGRPISLEKIKDDSLRKAVYPFADFVVEPKAANYVLNKFKAQNIYLSIDEDGRITALSIYLLTDADAIYAALEKAYGPAQYKGSMNAAEAFGAGSNVVNYLWKVGDNCLHFQQNLSNQSHKIVIDKLRR